MTGRNKGRIFWTVLALAWLIGFANFEFYALTHDDSITLSRFMFDLGAGWSPIIFLLGLTVGILVQHFWSHVGAGWEQTTGMDLPERIMLLAIAWAIVVVLTPGGPAIFLAGLPIGMLVTKLWWVWNPEDQKDHRG